MRMTLAMMIRSKDARKNLVATFFLSQNKQNYSHKATEQLDDRLPGRNLLLV